MKCEAQFVSNKGNDYSPSDIRPHPNARRAESASRFAESRLMCEMHNGIPMVHGGNSSYYIFNKDGQRLLILTRKENESIVVDDMIDIVVLEINNNEVKIGILGPEDTLIHCIDNDNSQRTAPRPR
jgi:hypothetical protein